MGSRFFMLLITALATACTYSNAGEMPVANGDVPPIALNLSGNCEGVGGSYDNAGVALRAQVVQNPRLAYSLFRLALLSKDGYPLQPRSVTLLVDPAEMTLRVTVIGEGAVREWSTRYECIDGWMHVRDNQGKQYLGDGVMQLWSKRDVLLTSDADGNLIAHTVGQSEDRAFLIKHRPRGEGWYLFRRQDTD